MSEISARPLDRRPDELDDEQLVAALRGGDEHAFMVLVGRYGPLMLRVASTYVRTPAVAEEVVQETWLAVLEGVGRFEGRSSLKTWVFRILANRAKTRGERESRCVPFSCVAARGDGEDDGPAVEPDRFLGADHPQWPGHWAAAPGDWATVPDVRLLSQETLAHVRDAIAVLPERQQDVIVLRDVEGWSAEEVCDALGVSEVNQRVLLHRARSKVRAALERYFDTEAVPS
jgi:RNA polymerase sigma-70 factor (ECF subfamily)